MSADADFPPLTAFMPHRPPMLLLDRLTACTDLEATCIKTIREGDPFVEDGTVSALIALELFAQTAAAHFGYLGFARGAGFAAGALLGTRKLELHVDRYRVGDELEIRARQVMTMPPAAQYECTLLRAGETVASGTLNVAIGGAVEER
jgi:predicted hotdog family 3-hydroxylacyl-ACP dehydratase